MNNSFEKNNIGNILKIYLFPVLVSVLSMIIWRDITELKNDVKMLLAQSNIDKTRIDHLEKQILLFQQKQNITNSKKTDFPKIAYDNYFKHEDFFYVDNNIKSEDYD